MAVLNLAGANFALRYIVPDTAHDYSDVILVDDFGFNPEIDTTSDPEDVWAQGGTYTYLSTAQTLYVSSSDSGDDQTITIEGLDANWDRQTVTVSLNGTAQAAISGTWIRINKAYNSDSTTYAGDVYIAETDTLTSGVPDTASKIKAKMTSTSQQTQLSHYSIPRNYTGYMFHWWGDLLGNSNADVDIELQVRLTGSVFRTRDNAGLAGAGTSHFQHQFDLPIPYPAKTDLKVVVRETDANGTAVGAGYQLLLIKNDT